MVLLDTNYIIGKYGFDIIALLIVVVFTGFFDHHWLTLQQNMLLLGVVFGLRMDSTSTNLN